MTIFCPSCFSPIDQNGNCPECGRFGKTQFLAQQLPPGTILNNRYRIGKTLGQGAFGITYLCLDQDTGNRVAIKEYFPAYYVQRVEKDMELASEQKHDAVIGGLEAFFDEVKILMEFNTHPNIVRILDYFFENKTAYFLMEYISGSSFKEVLHQNGGRISYQKLMDLLMPLLPALGLVHQAGLLHRDISPDNIFISADNVPVILDFGSARFAWNSEMVGKLFTIKPGYAPIEQYRDFSVQGNWTDIYQMGAVFYRALTGQLPEEAILRAQFDTLRSPLEIGFSVPLHVDKAIMKALALEPADRYQSFEEMVDDILPI
ncbi:MAG: serine/threonine protein kinase [Chloroflexi bacterium]|nr:serine/threonine protein kinase [Chloroflexota bacterium]